MITYSFHPSGSMTIKLSSAKGGPTATRWKSFGMLTHQLARSLMPYCPTAKLLSWLESLRRDWNLERVDSVASSLRLELTPDDSHPKRTLLVEALMHRTLTTGLEESSKRHQVFVLHTPISKRLSPMRSGSLAVLAVTLLLAVATCILLLRGWCGPASIM